MTQIFKPALLGVFMLAAAGAATGASAAGQGRMGLPSFESLDSAGTGQISPEQFQALMQAPQERLVARLMEQANDDGLLDEAALRAGLASLRPEARGDDRRAERAQDRGARLFSRIDSNNDGVIDAEEYARFTDRMEERSEKRQKPRGRW
ncbi:MAG: EF-hand domain-containing protein [Roseinatronobacter sp.]|jgi:Ca2+-binding EF-hand superfamily protein|nr:EF-hand domain-containing protein [Roseinatronobacter sp.]